MYKILKRRKGKDRHTGSFIKLNEGTAKQLQGERNAPKRRQTDVMMHELKASGDIAPSTKFLPCTFLPFPWSSAMSRVCLFNAMKMLTSKQSDKSSNQLNVSAGRVPARLAVFNSPWNPPHPHLTCSISSRFHWTHLFYSQTQQVNSINCPRRTKSSSSHTFDKNPSSGKLVAGERKAKEIRFKWNIPRLGKKMK